MFHFLLDSDKDNNTNEADPWIPVASCTLSKAAPPRPSSPGRFLARLVHMDATPISALLLTVVFAAIGLYSLYFVVRSGVRDGILQADEKRSGHKEAQPPAG